MKSSKNILICPLEWGLGHAGRMIPMAAKLRDLGNNVFIGSGERVLSFFNQELKGITLINFPGFRPKYSRFLPQYAVLLLQVPVLIYHIAREHYKLKKIIAGNRIDIVISDNRFGLWNKKIRSVYITHMPLIPFPGPFRFLEFTGIFLHRLIIKRYNFCLIPDLPGNLNISGRLSHGLINRGNTRYIGILSRFPHTILNSRGPEEKKDETVVILSGPEPQKSILKNKLIKALSQRGPVIILEGKPGQENKTNRSGNFTCCDNPSGMEMEEMLTSGKRIISRAGYTTIMELISLECSALLIPTPGQTEQEYLAGYLAEKGWFTSVSQKKINATDLNFSPSFNKEAKMIREMSCRLLDKVLDEILDF